MTERLVPRPGSPLVGARAAARRPALAVALRAAALGAVGVPLLVRLHATGGYDVAPVPLCPFHALTGWWCPLCGSLRAVADLTRLDPVAALSSNVVVTPLLVVVLYGLLAWSLAPVAGRRLPPVAVPDRVWVVLGAVLLVFTVWRNLPGLPLGAWLAP